MRCAGGQIISLFSQMARVCDLCFENRWPPQAGAAVW
jgi:hypothetical protein